MERHVHGHDGDLQHLFIGLLGGEALQLQAGPAQGVGQLVVAVGQALEHLVAHTGHDGQQGQAGQKAQDILVAIVAHQGEEDDAQREHDEQERRAAAGMQGGEGGGILGGEGLIRFVAIDSLVFGTVILEGAAHIRHEGAEHHIADEDGNAHQAGEQVHRNAAQAQGTQAAGRSFGDDEEQANGEDHRQHDGHTHDYLVNTLAQLLGQPLLELGGLFIHDAQHFGGGLQGVHAHGQHGAKVHNAADDGPAHPLVLLGGGHIFGALDHNGIIRTAHGDGDGVGGLHHDAFHHSLAANINAGAGGSFVCHKGTSFLRRKRGSYNGQVCA